VCTDTGTAAAFFSGVKAWAILTPVRSSQLWTLILHIVLRIDLPVAGTPAVGSGGYADIYRVTDIASGATYALKHLRLNGDPQLIVEVQREAKTQVRSSSSSSSNSGAGVRSWGM
jgi:hypothetical protein